jgi:hypothetical protein
MSKYSDLKNLRKWLAVSYVSSESDTDKQRISSEVEKITQEMNDIDDKLFNVTLLSSVEENRDIILTNVTMCEIHGLEETLNGLRSSTWWFTDEHSAINVNAFSHIYWTELPKD